MRGIDAYSPAQLSLAFRNAVALFQYAHGRMPDLVNLPEAADHFFKMKFFDFIPIDPNPASKLDCARYVPPTLRNTVRVPAHPWVSHYPKLPPNDSVPPGIYWLKLEFGNANHVKLEWPLPPTARNKVERFLSVHFNKRFGPDCGEWWYGIGPQRVFLEEDLSAVLANGIETKVYVRGGRVAAGYLVRYVEQDGRKRNEIRFFDGSGTPLSGTLRLTQQNEAHAQSPLPLPAGFNRLLAAAAEIGRPFDLVRVDMFTRTNGETYLGELSLCHGNATVIFEPPAFASFVKQALFQPATAEETVD